MAYKYGVKAVVKDSVGVLPVSTGTCVVFIGSAHEEDQHYGVPVKCTSYADYLDKFQPGEGGDAPSVEHPLDQAARIAFNLVGIDHAFFVNINENGEGDLADVSATGIADVARTALRDIVLTSSERPNVVCVPRLSEYSLGSGTTISTLWSSLSAVCNGGVDNRYSSICVLDVPMAANQITNGKPVPASISIPSRSKYIVAAWGMIADGVNDGEIVGGLPLSAIIAAMYAAQDARNTGEVPYRSIGNLPIAWADDLCIKVGTTYTKCVASQDDMSAVCAKGIITAVNLGNRKFHTWGDHTAAGGEDGTDPLAQFDSSMRMMIHLFNRFIDQWRDSIDNPMALALRNDIVNSEQSYLDYLVTIGALIGSPKCEFRPEDNTELALGYFYFSDTYTATIPAKYIQLNLTHTSEGLRAYLA